MILRFVHKEPMWGYRIIKLAELEYGVKIGHGTVYPLLNDLEKRGLLRSRKESKKGRLRKIYKITSKGLELLDTFNESIGE
ncbi:MAG: PadR family transcriptional regulator [Candidatus Bathyarchaeota archaeon]|nr:MAG: PadR family transcriptional regulator [Candidatus Bathyarchaeota archaeon]